MSNLKFRGKSIRGEWYYGGITENKDYIVRQFTFQNVQAETVGQFTGLHDTNGNEIYEGDILKINEIPCIVKWLNGKARFAGVNDAMYLSMPFSGECRIAGNVHDNPHRFEEMQKNFLKLNK